MTTPEKERLRTAMHGLIAFFFFWIFIACLYSVGFGWFQKMQQEIDSFAYSSGLPRWLFGSDWIVTLAGTLYLFGPLVAFAVWLERRRIKREFSDGQLQTRSRIAPGAMKRDRPISVWTYIAALSIACVYF